MSRKDLGNNPSYKIMLIDTHSHCYWDTIYPRVHEVIDSMRGYAVTHAIQIGCDMDSSQQAIDLARGYPDVFRATVGIHPNECDKYDISYIENMIKNIDRMIQENRDYVVGIGETGLDFHYLPDDSL